MSVNTHFERIFKHSRSNARFALGAANTTAFLIAPASLRTPPNYWKPLPREANRDASRLNPLTNERSASLQNLTGKEVNPLKKILGLQRSE